jgi:hypothetical protein
MKFVKLDLIAAFTNLQRLSFGVYSLTTAAGAVQMFRQLDHLDRLTLRRPRVRLNAYDWAPINPSTDGEVMQPIKLLWKEA